MSASLTYEIGLGKFGEQLGKQLAPQMALTMVKAAQHVTGAIRKETQEGSPEGKGGLARSFRETFLGWSGEVVSAISHSDLVYARIQDRGGTILPKNGSALAIPFRGVPLGMGPRNFGGSLFLIKRPGRNALLATKRGKRGIDPKFTLVKQVTLSGKGYLARAREESAPGVAAIIQADLRRYVERSKGG